MRNDSIKVGVIGVGHLGQHHVKHYASIPNAELIGVFDEDYERAKTIANSYGTIAFKDIDSLIMKTEAVSIVTPTKHHAKISEQCLLKNNHIFIEKPITKTLEEADRLLLLAEKKHRLIQVGHIERLNPALIALNSFDLNPKFIEIQRLAPYTTRGTDVPVVLDLMIHDIDILLALVAFPVKEINATGLSILTNSVDIAHARINFSNGTVASVLSSRIAKDRQRKIKLFQKDLYATIDLLIGSTEIYKVEKISEKNKSIETLMTTPFNYEGEKKIISYEKLNVIPKDALWMELENFIKSIQGKETPIVTGKDGRDALKVALEIQDIIIKDIN